MVLGEGKFSPWAMYCRQAAEIVVSSCPWLWDTLLRNTRFGASGSWSLGGSLCGILAPPDFLKQTSPALLKCHVLLWIKSLSTWNSVYFFPEWILTIRPFRLSGHFREKWDFQVCIVQPPLQVTLRPRVLVVSDWGGGGKELSSSYGLTESHPRSPKTRGPRQ